MKIIDASFDERDPMMLVNMIQNSKTIKELFGKDWQTIIRWMVVDTEQENRSPVTYIQTADGSYYTTASGLTKKLQDYDLKCKSAKRDLPRAKFYSKKSEKTGNTFFAIYFEEQL